MRRREVLFCRPKSSYTGHFNARCENLNLDSRPRFGTDICVWHFWTPIPFLRILTRQRCPVVRTQSTSIDSNRHNRVGRSGCRGSFRSFRPPDYDGTVANARLRRGWTRDWVLARGAMDRSGVVGVSVLALRRGNAPGTGGLVVPGEDTRVRVRAGEDADGRRGRKTAGDAVEWGVRGADGDAVGWR